MRSTYKLSCKNCRELEGKNWWDGITKCSVTIDEVDLQVILQKLENLRELLGKKLPRRKGKRNIVSRSYRTRRVDGRNTSESATCRLFGGVSSHQTWLSPMEESSSNPRMILVGLAELQANYRVIGSNSRILNSFNSTRSSSSSILLVV